MDTRFLIYAYIIQGFTLVMAYSIYDLVRRCSYVVIKWVFHFLHRVCCFIAHVDILFIVIIYHDEFIKG